MVIYSIMQALVTLLPEPFFQMVEDIWTELETGFGCQHTFTRPKPHFTWQYADSYDDAYAPKLEEICSGVSSFETQTDVVTRFSESDPVLFLRIVPTPELIALHQKLWEGLSPFWYKPSLLYQPADWVPHITLSMGTDSWCHQKAAIDFLTSLKLHWTFKVDRLTMLELNENNEWDGGKVFFFGRGDTSRS